MAFAMKDLIRLVPPPNHPVAAVGDWNTVEQSIQTALPKEYKQIVETYGSGKFFDRISIFSPFVKNAPWSFQYQLRIASENFRTYIEQGFKVSFSAFPDREGLACFGTTENCSYLSWVTKGVPNKWPITFWDTGYTTIRQLPRYTIAKLLVTLASRKNIACDDGDLFPDDIFERIAFTPQDYDTAEYGFKTD